MLLVQLDGVWERVRFKVPFDTVKSTVFSGMWRRTHVFRRKVTLDTEDGGSAFLWNVSESLPSHSGLRVIQLKTGLPKNIKHRLEVEFYLNSNNDVKPYVGVHYTRRYNF
jgi:hypothetical protein